MIRLSEVIKRARDKGPQTVTVRDERAAVVLAAAEYDRLIQPPKTLLELLTGGPDLPDEVWELIGHRDESPPRTSDPIYGRIHQRGVAG